MRLLQSCLAAAAIMTLGVAAASAQTLQTTPTSSAYGVAGSLNSQGTATGLPAVAHISGVGHKAYSHSSFVPLFSEALGLASNGNLIGEMAVITSGIVTHVSGTGPGGATVQTEGNVSIASVDMTLSLLPTGGSQIAPVPLLALSVSNLTGSTTVSQTGTASDVATGSASFGSLTLTGSLVGNQTLTFSGSAPPNTVLYEDAHLTVTLNEQMVSGTVVCAPACAFAPQGMVTYPIAVEMAKDTVAGKPASGTLFVGTTSAQIP